MSLRDRQHDDDDDDDDDDDYDYDELIKHDTKREIFVLWLKINKISQISKLLPYGSVLRFHNIYISY